MIPPQSRIISAPVRIDAIITTSSQSDGRTAMADFASVMQKVDKPPPSPPADARVIQQDDLRLYKARWIILVVYMLYSMANAVHWLQYSIISNITVKFYGVSNFAIDTTSTIYMIVYVPLVVPASWVLDRLVRDLCCISFVRSSSLLSLKWCWSSASRFFNFFRGYFKLYIYTYTKIIYFSQN